MAVSYTHLDVYKRQVLLLPRQPFIKRPPLQAATFYGDPRGLLYYYLADIIYIYMAEIIYYLADTICVSPVKTLRHCRSEEDILKCRVEKIRENSCLNEQVIALLVVFKTLDSAIVFLLKKFL